MPEPAWVAAAALLIAAGVELALRVTPEYDPYGWLVWGRQTLHLALDTGGAPSWKPLPWLVTTPLSLAGSAAPTLWLIIACAAGLVCLWLAYRIGERLAGPVAGVIAVAGILISRDWLVFMVTGNIEPATAALVLGAVLSHILERRRVALLLLAAATLARPECGAVLVIYGAYLWRLEPNVWRLELGVVVGLGLLWIMPPYIATGHGFTHSDPVFQSGQATQNPLTLFHRAGAIVIWPVGLAALVGVALAFRQPPRQRRVALGIAAGSTVWILATGVMALAGFPGLERFMLPAAAAACVLAGFGVVWAAAPLRRMLRSPRWAISVALALAVAAPSAWYAQGRLRTAASSIRLERARSKLDRSLQAVITAAGGRRRLLSCGLVSAEVGYQSVLAWDLRTAVGKILYRPAHDIHRHHALVLMVSPQIAPLGNRGVLLARRGPWRIVALRPRHRCGIAPVRG